MLSVKKLIYKMLSVTTGTTDVEGVTWTRAGNVVTVSIKRGTTVNTTISGLPTPSADYLVAMLLNGDNNPAGYIQYNLGAWTIKTLYNIGNYGTLTYTCG